jgi:hypothetical protein
MRSRIASLSGVSFHFLSEPKKTAAKNARRETAAIAPRSDKNATQSLLGHGFAVIPLSARDLSLTGAYFG